MRPRDTDELYEKYDKFLDKLLKEELSRFSYKDPITGRVVYDKAKVDDLKSYIDYQFVKLVNEYDPNSAVDFPGYIKSKLPLRVRHSYLKRYFSHYYKTHNLQKDNNELVESTLYQQSLEDWFADNDHSELLDRIEELNLTPIELDVVSAWLQPPEVKANNMSVPINNSDRTVCGILKNKYPDYSRDELNRIIKTVLKKLKDVLSPDSF